MIFVFTYLSKQLSSHAHVFPFENFSLPSCLTSRLPLGLSSPCVSDGAPTGTLVLSPISKAMPCVWRGAVVGCEQLLALLTGKTWLSEPLTPISMQNLCRNKRRTGWWEFVGREHTRKLLSAQWQLRWSQGARSNPPFYFSSLTS